MNNAANDLFQFDPEIIQPTGTHGTKSAAEELRIGIMQREHGIYLRIIVGNDLARTLGLRVGSRVSFGVAKDGKAAVMVPSPGTGYKLTRQSATSTTLMVKADKLGLEGLKVQPTATAKTITYDSQLIIDLAPLYTEKGA